MVFAAQKLEPEAHTPLFVLSVLAIVPLAVLLSHATESVAANRMQAGLLFLATIALLIPSAVATADFAAAAVYLLPPRAQ